MTQYTPDPRLASSSSNLVYYNYRIDSITGRLERRLESCRLFSLIEKSRFISSIVTRWATNAFVMQHRRVHAGSVAPQSEGPACLALTSINITTEFLRFAKDRSKRFKK